MDRLATSRVGGKQMYQITSLRPASPSFAAPDLAPGIPYFEFSTAPLASENQFRAWQDAHSSVLDMSVDDPNAPFDAAHKTWFLEGMAFQTLGSDPVQFASLGNRPNRNALDHWAIAVIVRGELQSQTSRRQVRSSGNTPLVFSLAEMFTGTFSGGKVHVLYVARDTCREAAHIVDSACMSLLASGIGSLFADYMLSLESQLGRMRLNELPELRSATQRLLLAAIAPTLDRVEEIGPFINHALLERAKRCIHKHLQDPRLDVPFLLKELGVSRSRLYRLFEPLEGISHYIQRRRLLAARSILADPDSTERIFEVAERFCFNDGAEFSRAFRREFGCSPSEARHAGEFASVTRRPEGSDLSAILRRM